MRWLEAEHPDLVVTSPGLGKRGGQIWTLTRPSQRFGLMWAGPELLFPAVGVGRVCSAISHLPESRQAPLHLPASTSTFQKGTIRGTCPAGVSPGFPWEGGCRVE